MAKKSSAHERQPAALSYEKMKIALPKIDRRIAEIKALDIQAIREGNEPSLFALSQNLDQFLIDVFSNNTHEYFKYHPYSEVRVMPLMMREASVGQTQLWVRDRINNAITMLETIKAGFIEALEDAGMSGTTGKALKAYEGLELHTEIAHAASGLFRDGYYASAIENAVKALINLIQLRTNLDEDGVSLMQKAFSPKKPILKFNALANENDHNEQKGFMDWFTGTVSGLRNPRAHKIIKDDPEMALEFIAFISLQAKLVDKAATVHANHNELRDLTHE